MSGDREGFEEPRTLVLCFDGTNEEYGDENTNVVKFFSLLKKDDFTQQECYYQAGVGTFFAPGVVSPIFQWFAKILDEAIAWYMNAHVMDGYRFLMQNYRVGDKICIFGFSRGAYTARALGGMLLKVGLLPRDNQEQIPFAFKMYKSGNANLSTGFKKTYCQDVEIEFMGVWDTVASVGVIMSHNLPFTNLNTAIKTFRHALSLDEHRVRFLPYLYRTSLNANKSNGIIDKDTPTETDALEVWFSGCHSDIGGGAVPNATKQDLSDITLRWMVREVAQSTCGVLFDRDALNRLNIPLDESSSRPRPSSDPESSAVSDEIDAAKPLHDALKLSPMWWILEILPLQYKYQDARGKWKTTYKPHLGKGRMINDPRPNFHITVKERMTSMSYVPKAKWKEGTEVYVN